MARDNFIRPSSGTPLSNFKEQSKEEAFRNQGELKDPSTFVDDIPVEVAPPPVQPVTPAPNGQKTAGYMGIPMIGWVLIGGAVIYYFYGKQLGLKKK